MDLGYEILHNETLEKERVVITGHSLGGGLASACAALAQTKGVTFNAAGLHHDTLIRYCEDFYAQDPIAYADLHPPKDLRDASHVTAYLVAGEVLHWAQSLDKVRTGDANGDGMRDGLIPKLLAVK